MKLFFYYIISELSLFLFNSTYFNECYGFKNQFTMKDEEYSLCQKSYLIENDMCDDYLFKYKIGPCLIRNPDNDFKILFGLLTFINSFTCLMYYFSNKKEKEEKFESMV